MSLKDLTLNELYERLWRLRAHHRHAALKEYLIIEELKRREGERDR